MRSPMFRRNVRGLHLCWGNYEGPHHHDVALGEILDIVLQAKPQGLSYEASNPRHAHEWAVFEEIKLPEGKVLIPGVIDSVTNFVEHPELVAQRIEQAREAGRARECHRRHRLRFRHDRGNFPG